MEPNKEILLLKKEISCLQGEFATKYFAHTDALHCTIKALTQLHGEQNCPDCFCGKSVHSETTKDSPNKETDISFDDEIHISETVEKSFRKSIRNSIRKSRKSVCVLPKFVSSSESENETDNGGEGDDQYLSEDSPVFIRKRNIASTQCLSSDEEESEPYHNAKLLTNNIMSDDNRNGNKNDIKNNSVLSSDETESELETDKNPFEDNSKSCNQSTVVSRNEFRNSQRISKDYNHLRNASRERTVSTDLIESDDEFGESYHNLSEQFNILSSDETESETEVTSNNTETCQINDITLNELQSLQINDIVNVDENIDHHGTPIRDDIIDSPAVLNGFLNNIFVEETPATALQHDFKSKSFTTYCGNVSNTNDLSGSGIVNTDVHRVNEAENKFASTHSHNDKVVEETPAAIVFNGKVSPTDRNVSLEVETTRGQEDSVSLKSKEWISTESDLDETEDNGQYDETKRRITYGNSDDETSIDLIDPSEKDFNENQNENSDKEREGPQKEEEKSCPKGPYIMLSSDDEDVFDNFVSLLQTTKRRKSILFKHDDMTEFIVQDTEVTPIDNHQVFKTPKPLLRHKSTNLVLSDDDDDDDDDDRELPTRFKTPKTDVTKKKSRTFRTPATVGKSVFNEIKTPKSDYGTPAYKRQFKKLRDSTVQEYFQIFNDTVFDGKLPLDFQINWNSRMRKTAGFCYYSTTAFGKRQSRIELSDKVIDCVERVRDTLIHELCHAATWLFDGNKNAAHGPVWKKWAKKANHIHPSLPVITTCHQYEIQTKYKYQCNGCSYVFGRHSKSIDPDKHRCGRCNGIPVLMNNQTHVPKTPNSYATFVKNNFASIKKENPNLSHKELMGIVSVRFKQFKISSNENKEN